MKYRHLALFAALLALLPWAAAQGSAAAPASIAGLWEGTAQTGNGAVPFRLEIKGNGDRLEGALLNGNERSPSTRGSYSDGHLVLNFDYFANAIDATVSGADLRGTFGGRARPVAIVAHRAGGEDPPATAADAPAIGGDWEIAVPNRPKGEPAWKLHLEQHGASLTAVILRVDGDTGRLYGGFRDGVFTVSKFNADGPSLMTITPQPDGTLRIVQRLRAAPLIARRPALAREAGLPPPDDPTQHTSLRDPNQPLAFSFPDLNGHVISNTDAQFKDKVVIVAIGGSWCPNCHDEAPFLEQLYRRYHRRGLEVVALSFEEREQLQNPTRLRAFIRRYGVTYPVLLAGETGELNDKLPQAVNLNCWPTTFFVGRDGLVKAIHAGYAGPATPENAALRADVNQLVTRLLEER